MSALITGLPGAAKTLFTIDHIIKLTKSGGPDAPLRPVYYSGIPQLKLPWIEMSDASKWTDCPDGSIIIIDEAQNTFRPRAYTGSVPLHVSAVETHRHRGIDLFLITQHPTLVDKNLHRLLDRHYHLVRKFNLHWSTVHEFFEVREHPDRYRVGSVETQFSFPEDVFKLYKSAELHTRKRRIPARVKFLFLAPFLLLALCYFGYRHFINTYSNDKPKENENVVKAKSTGKNQVGSVPRSDGGVGDSATAYLASFVPAVPGLAYTAPAYAKATEVKVAPAPTGCISIGERCSCYTDQATKLPDVPDAICRQIVSNGFFVAWQERQPITPQAVGGGPERPRPAPPPPADTNSLPAAVATLDNPPHVLPRRAPSAPPPTSGLPPTGTPGQSPTPSPPSRGASANR